jgi:Skp family chaperone for outer membrane proteins
MNKKFLFSLLLLIIVLCFGNADTKFDRIAIINLDQVIEKVFSGSRSSTVQSIKLEKQKIQDNLNKIKDNVIKLDDEKSKETDEAKKLVINKKIEELKKQYSDNIKLSTLADQKLKNAQESLFKDIYAVAKRIAETEGFTIVFDSTTVFYFSSDNDITQKVIDRLKAGQ